MKARAIFAAFVGLSIAASPGLAQETPAPPPAQNTQTEVIGPPQLRDFSLNGTVTRRPEPAPPAPTARQPAQRPQPASGGDARASRQQPPSARDSAAAPREAAPAEPQLPTASVQGGLTARQPAPTPSAPVPFEDVAPPVGQVVDAPSTLSPMLPWLAAALGLGGVAAWFFLRQRPRHSFAGAGTNRLDVPPDHSSPPAPSPRPAPARVPAAAAPVPQAAPQPAPKLGPGGTIVSTRLRPWLEIEFIAHRTVVKDDVVGVEFEASVFNSGSVPARDVLVEARLLNAGAEHLEELRRFYTEPVAQGGRVPVIDPLKRVTVRNAVLLPRTQVQPIEIEGRQLLVPVVAFNALYSWASGKGQTSTSFVVGKQTQGEKLAPFRLDSGARLFRNLAAREHELRVRS